MLGDTVPFIDIIIFAIIAVLLVLRLRSVLGQRTGYEEKQTQKSNFDTAAADVIPIDSGRKTAASDGHGIDALRKADRQFSEKQFLEGAAMAFDMILQSYATGDLAQLKRLLSYDLLQSFMQTIHDRTAAKESLEITINDIREVRILNVELVDSVASITVHFHTTQTRIARDEQGDVMEERDIEPQEFIDIWTFERDLTLSDPNWKLAETESADEDN